jgi:ubiquinone/menaquinone biosynthesis C-methylase UbiE
MPGRNRCAYSVLLLFVLSAAPSAQRSAALFRQELEQATREVPKLADVLSLKPGMTVADVGSGGGAMAVRMAEWLGPDGRVFATDVREAQLAEIRANVAHEGRTNVLVLEGAARSTNLPDGCCDAIFLRDVYHHLTHPQEFGASLFASLKPGGRLAIIDFQPEPGSSIPQGVPQNREGHGIPVAVIVSELTQAGFRHAATVSRWPGDTDRDRLFLVAFDKP